MSLTVLADNWNYTYYKNDKLKAMVTMGHEFSEDESLESYYFITLTDEENNDICQTKFQSLNAACKTLNTRYNGFWEFQSMEKPVSTGGCSTCVAH